MNGYDDDDDDTGQFGNKPTRRQTNSSKCFIYKIYFVSRNTALLVRDFVTYVRPLLEYNSVIWSPHHK